MKRSFPGSFDHPIIFSDVSVFPSGHLPIIITSVQHECSAEGSGREWIRPLTIDAETVARSPGCGCTQNDLLPAKCSHVDWQLTVYDHVVPDILQNLTFPKKKCENLF